MPCSFYLYPIISYRLRGMTDLCFVMQSVLDDRIYDNTMMFITVFRITVLTHGWSLFRDTLYVSTLTGPGDWSFSSMTSLCLLASIYIRAPPYTIPDVFLCFKVPSFSSSVKTVPVFLHILLSLRHGISLYVLKLFSSSVSPTLDSSRCLFPTRVPHNPHPRPPPPRIIPRSQPRLFLYSYVTFKLILSNLSRAAECGH